MGRKIRVTKVPFSAAAKALINTDTRGFVKILSDPATGVVLGGSIVGRHAAELISVIALAVTANLQGQRHRREPAGAPLALRGPGRSRRVTGSLARQAPPPSVAATVAAPVSARESPQGSAAVAGGLPSRLLDDDDDVAGADGVAGCDLDRLDRAGLLGVDLVLHLHGLEHHDGLTDLDGLTHRRPAPSRSCPAWAR